MAYDKQTWTDNETLINAERMNHIEDGIAKLSESAIAAMQVEGEDEITLEPQGIEQNGIVYEVPDTPLAAIVRLDNPELIGVVSNLTHIGADITIYNPTDSDQTVGTYTVTIFYMK